MTAFSKRSVCLLFFLFPFFQFTRTLFAQIDRPSPVSVDILIDTVHANDYSETGGLLPEEHDYHRVFGFRWAFDYLKHKNVRVGTHAEGRLTPEILSRCKVLFINLVSAECPPFYVSEIRAIVGFIENGGSLLLITEHSNAYFHAWRLAPLLEELGLVVHPETACDVRPYTLGMGNGWLLVQHFTEHPVTKGLRRIHFQTGGCLDDRFAVARLSPEAWGDFWIVPPFGEAKNMGFFGNWKRDEGERSGPHAAHVAKEFGKGRIVIAADQNMFGDPCIDYADNNRLWNNSVAWLLHAETDPRFADLTDPLEYRKFREPKILLVEDFFVGAWGTDEKGGCYHLRSLINRSFPTFTDDRYDDSYELLVLPSGQLKMSDEIVDMLAGHLRRGRNVLALHTPVSVIGEPDSVLVKTFQKLRLDDPRFEMLDDLVGVCTLDNGAKIFLFLPELILLNSVLPRPEDAPNVWQKYRIDVFQQKFKLVFDPKTE